MTSYTELLVNSGLARSNEMVGLSDEEISEIESKFNMELPAEYKSFMKLCGKKAGLFFKDSDFFFPYVLSFREELSEMLEDEEIDIEIPSNAFVFSAHQGYQYLYFLCGHDDDPQVLKVTDGGKPPAVIAPTFTSFIESSIVQYKAAISL